MERKHVHSSRIVSIGHQIDTLEVEFKSKDIDKPNPVYRYTPVSDTKYNSLLNSFTVGKDIQEIIDDKTILCVKQ
jgi:hypothetical protein